MINSLPSSEMINYTRYDSYDDSKWVKLDLINCVNMDEKQITKLLSRVSIGIAMKLRMNMMIDWLVGWRRRVNMYFRCLIEIDSQH